MSLFRFLFYLNLLVLGAVGILLAHWHVQRKSLRQIITGKFGSASDPLSAVRGFAGWIHAHVPRGRDPLFISPAFQVVGATPIAVLRSGGCCSGLARLCIVGLEALEIKAVQITLYHVSGCAQHCAVEVALGDVHMIVDPLYGLYYTDRDGAPLGLEGLQAGRVPELHPLPLSTAATYPPYPYYHFNYENTKTANWTGSAPRRAAYRILRGIYGGRIDRCRLPAILEWPQTLISTALLGGAGVVDLLLLLI